MTFLIEKYRSKVGLQYNYKNIVANSKGGLFILHTPGSTIKMFPYQFAINSNILLKWNFFGICIIRYCGYIIG